MERLEIDLTPNQIASICGISTRTARRWISGHSRPKKGHRELLELYSNGRIMPPKWPNSFRFAGNHLDTGHKQSLAWQQLDWYFYSIHCWHQLLDLIPRIEARLDALARVSPPAVVVDLQHYRDELKRLKERPFALPANVMAYYQIDEKQVHRTHGC